MGYVGNSAFDKKDDIFLGQIETMNDKQKYVVAILFGIQETKQFFFFLNQLLKKGCSGVTQHRNVPLLDIEQTQVNFVDRNKFQMKNARRIYIFVIHKQLNHKQQNNDLSCQSSNAMEA